MRLKRKVPALLVLMLFITCTKAATFKNGVGIFRTDTIHEIRLTFTQENFWDSLVTNYDVAHDSIPADDVPIIASVMIDGLTIDSIGAKLKGNFSYELESDKKPIKLYFNEYVKGKNFQGLHRLNLSNEFPDISMLRNTIAFKLLRDEGVMAPRTSFARVYINGKYHGLYVLIEQVDKNFLSNYFESPNGDLAKAASSFLYWFDHDTSSFYSNFEIKSKDMYGATMRLIGLARKINATSAYAFYDSLNSTFDFNTYVKTLAADILFNNWDSYFYGQNYYLYHDSALHKFFYIPWDFNLALNNYDVSGGDFNIVPQKGADPIFDLPLPSKVIYNKQLKKKYLEALRSLNRRMGNPALKNYIYKLHDMLRPALNDDNGKIFTMDQYEKSLTQKDAISEIEMEGLLTFIQYRHAQVEKMIKAAELKK